ncbi:hypothetical protein HYFRA_00001820 [Hymenoscyphus fraxineus]|uniref:Uncharacterized protein n=1 Tax=Hymenoscyphus fraxineus TaxID=746836 RepID=A0A9N9KK53_9HELO|nr:hypothetical protein HYFRA_00001820 [Hymenoscyphus fraxineus]
MSQHYRQPQGAGNIVHTYIPRIDGAIMVGGVAYYPHTDKQPEAPLASHVVGSLAAAAMPAMPPVFGQPAPEVPVQPVGYVAPAAGPVYGADDYISPYGPKIPDPVYHPVHNPAWFHAHTGFWPPYNEHFGHTPSEIIQQQLATAEAQGKGKQEMKPADDDPHRWYWVRELDDTWTQRNRLTIDSDGFGEVIWYVNKGEFYAVRKRKN